jgi:hypothetical protein
VKWPTEWGCVGCRTSLAAQQPRAPLSTPARFTFSR